MRHLDRHAPLELIIVGQVHAAKAAFTQDAFDAIPPNQPGQSCSRRRRRGRGEISPRGVRWRCQCLRNDWHTRSLVVFSHEQFLKADGSLTARHDQQLPLFHPAHTSATFPANPIEGSQQRRGRRGLRKSSRVRRCNKGPYFGTHPSYRQLMPFSRIFFITHSRSIPRLADAQQSKAFWDSVQETDCSEQQAHVALRSCYQTSGAPCTQTNGDPPL
jgi:hypothetical protein